MQHDRSQNVRESERVSLELERRELMPNVLGLNSVERTFLHG